MHCSYICSDTGIEQRASCEQCAKMQQTYVHRYNVVEQQNIGTMKSRTAEYCLSVCGGGRLQKTDPQRVFGALAQEVFVLCTNHMQRSQ